MSEAWDWQVALFRAINDAHTPAADLFFGQISALGDGLVAGAIAAALGVWRPRLGAVGLGAIVASGLVVQIFKHLLEVPRPAAVLDGVHALGGALYAHAFPSGHAATSGAMAGALWLAMRGRWAWLAALLWALAAIGRVYTGAHWPLDVAVGFAIGWACAWAGTRLIPELKDPEATRRWMLWLAMAGGTALVAFHTPHPHTARTFAAAVGLGSLAAAWLGWRRR